MSDRQNDTGVVAVEQALGELGEAGIERGFRRVAPPEPATPAPAEQPKEEQALREAVRLYEPDLRRLAEDD